MRRGRSTSHQTDGQTTYAGTSWFQLGRVRFELLNAGRYVLEVQQNVRRTKGAPTSGYRKTHHHSNNSVWTRIPDSTHAFSLSVKFSTALLIARCSACLRLATAFSFGRENFNQKLIEKKTVQTLFTKFTSFQQEIANSFRGYFLQHPVCWSVVRVFQLKF